MKTCNIEIGDVSIKKKYVSMFFRGIHSSTYLEFNTKNLLDYSRLHALMNYARVSNIDDLEGKFIREVDTNNNLICAIGDIIDDRFMPLFGEHDIELDKKQLQELIEISSPEIMSFQESVYGDD